MEVKETLAALEQVLLAARIANVSGTEDQWAMQTPSCSTVRSDW